MSPIITIVVIRDRNTTRRGKYPNIGIIDAIENLIFGGSSCSYEFVKNKTCKNKDDLRLFRKRIYSLKKGRFIEYSPGHNFTVTNKGRELINFHRLENLRISNYKPDKYWRIFIFDIPEEKRAARDILRSKLYEFNFYQIQKSVYVTPYPCERELNALIKLLAIEEYTIVMIAKSLGRAEDKIRRHYKL